MKILCFFQHFSTDQGSFSTRAYEFAKRLVAQGHAVTVVCGSNVQSKTGLSGSFKNRVRRGFVEGIQVIEVSLPYSNYDGFLKRSLIFLSFALKSVQFVFTEPYEILYASSTPLTVAIPGILAKWLRRKKFLFEVRDAWPKLPKAMGVIKNRCVLGMLSALEYAAYHSADHCIALAPGIATTMQERGIAQSKITLIPNGSDLGTSLEHDVKLERYETLGPEFSPDDLVCLFAGAHGLANGLDAVLKVAEILQQRGHTPIKFLFIGEGAQRPFLMQEVERKGLKNCIFKTPLPKRTLFRLMSCVDLGLMILKNVPAFYEGTSPNKFFDYIAAGLPVLANYPGWIANHIQQSHCGFVVPPEDPVAFADQLIWIQAHRTSLIAMGQNARNLAENFFSRDLLSQKLITVLEGL